jgi:hypothetical protein
MTAQSIHDLRATVRKLRPTGPDGFEGLMAAVLTDLTSRTFALASAGAQHGKDGQSALDGAIAFEAKLYEDAVAKDQILSKIAEIAGDEEGETELWILGSTGPVVTQHIETAKRVAKKVGVAVKVLAWPETGLSELATLLAMTPAVSAAFLAGKTGTPEAQIVEQIDAVRAHPQFSSRSAELLIDLQQPSLAPAYALKDNTAWLSDAFASKKRARAVFGQPLSPEDCSISSVLDRQTLRTRLAGTMFAKPDGSLTAILGADGNGKSWLFAQTWSSQTSKPLTLVMVPDDVPTFPTFESLRELLIAKLITQTGDTPNDVSIARWGKHFHRWQLNRDTESPRLLVFIDGLNQRETVNWPRFLDAMSELIANIGGKLVFSCRRLFYQDYLKGRLVSHVVECEVPEWSDEELEALLQPRGTSITTLDPGVVRSLRNPRLFGVAAELLKDRKIDAFSEISVNRLLFEYIRSGAAVDNAAISPNQFVADVRAHADSIVTRLKQHHPDDFTVFEMPNFLRRGHSSHAVTEQFVITSAGRFFEILPYDPSKYILKDEGLSLALGLSLVNSARTAIRQHKNVDEALANILDPISALDRTSDVLIGAIVTAVLEDAPTEVVAPLIRSYIALQNLDASRYEEFRALLRRNPPAFLAALEASALTEDVTSNLSWLTEAVEDSRGTPAVASALSDSVHRWLSMYSTAPDRQILTPRSKEYEEKWKEERTKRQTEIATKAADFSQVERDLLATLIQQNDGDYSRLNRLAFQFLARQPLAQYGASFRNWCFAASFNGGFYGHQDDFDHLLRFNVVDWSSTRQTMLDAAKLFRQPGMSTTGQWALVYLLRATGNSDDAKEAEAVAEELTRDWERRPGWHLVENYCATDPCDPNADRPHNIDATADKYLAIDVSKLRRARDQSTDDRFFDMARPGLARFEPNAAVATMRRFADQIVTRPTSEFRTGVFLLVNHAVVLEDRVAAPYVAKGAEIAKEALASGEDKTNERWVTAQYALLVAFPHMSGNAQFDALLAHPKDRTVLMDLSYLFQPCGPFKLEHALECGIADGDVVTQFRVLVFAERSRTAMTLRTKKMVASLVHAQHDHVRLSTLALIRRTNDSELLAALVNSDWSASKLDSAKHRVEMMHGSEAMVLAAEKGMLSIEACLERINLGSYQYLVSRLGAEAALAVAARLNIAIRKSADFKVEGSLPDIEQCFAGRHWSSVLEVSDKPVESDNTLQAKLQLFSETGDAWYERHRRNQEAAERFEGELTKAGAELVIQSVTVGLITAIDKADPSIIDSWLSFFMSLDENALNSVHNIALVVAEVVSKRDATSGLSLFQRLAASSPPVRVTFGRDHLGLDAVAAWGAAENNEMKALLFARLDRIGNDHDLAMEILAAIRAKRENVLRDYVFDRREREEPAHRARAMMVAGLSPDEGWALQTIGQFKDTHGFLHEAYTAAKYAMDRHQWSRHWAGLMSTATNPIDLWRYSILLWKIVDGRFNSLDAEGPSPSSLIRRFGVTLTDPIRHRIKRWKSHRESKLFGMTAPDRIFLPI